MDKMIKDMAERTGLKEQFFEAVLKRLASFGYTPVEEDSWAICFAAGKVDNHIKNYCNINVVPDELFHIAVDQTCGEFLYMKKQTGSLSIGGLDFSDAISSIKEGDTQVNFDSTASTAALFDQFIGHLMHKGEDGDLICFRKLKW